MLHRMSKEAFILTDLFTLKFLTIVTSMTWINTDHMKELTLNRKDFIIIIHIGGVYDSLEAPY